MADIIRLLPDSVANQIAAGEVIQRPASVVKELVENAIDAGASYIQIVVSDAGKTTIQVVDNGKGMSETDARLAFERHATSKIRQASDLFDLHTMGFRGEALASIAAVAQVELRTRTEDSELGISLRLAGSRIEGQEPIACPVGANFIVNNLFFNVPARRKFLKTNQTELSNIVSEVERIVLAHPEIRFTLSSNGTSLLNLATASGRQRIVDVFGKKMNRILLDLNVDTTIVRVRGYVGSPQGARKKGAQQYFFVNGRYMRHPYFHRAVMTPFEHLIPAGEQIPYFIYLEVDPSRIDVNIHPTKTEIKFEDEQAIWQILSAAVRESLGRYNAVPSIDFDVDGRPDIPPFQGDAPVELPTVEFDRNYNPFDNEQDTTSAVPPVYSYDRPAARRKGPTGEQWEDLMQFAVDAKNEPADVQAETPSDPAPVADEDEFAKWNAGSLTYYQYKGQYIMTSVKSGLLVIDQRRAHIRILYDRYMKQLKNRDGVSQGVLFPELVQLSPSQAVKMESLLDDLGVMGFDISDLGGGSYAINGIPAGTEGVNPSALLHSMLDEALMQSGQIDKDEINHLLALSLARKAAITAGVVLSVAEMEHMVDSLFATSTPNYTPDGKLILSVIQQEKIEQLFK